MVNTFKELFVQYCNAIGKKIDFSGTRGKEEIEKDMENFIKWFCEHSAHTSRYGRFLQHVVPGFDEKTVLELNKGYYDSLSKYCPNVDSMSTYRYAMDLDLGKTLVFGLDQDKRLIVPYGFDGIRNLRILDYDMLLSQNPYTYVIDDVHKALSAIHRQGNYDVSFGVFGEEVDADKKRKLELVKAFAHLLADDYKLSYETDEGLYFASVNSKRKTKVLIK